MKIESTTFQFSVGSLSGHQHYTLHLLFQEEAKEIFGKKFPFQLESKVFSGEFGQEFRDESAKDIYIGLGDKEKFNFWKVVHYFIKLGTKFSKLNDVGLQIQIGKDLVKMVTPEVITYQLSTALAIGAFPINLLNTKKKDKLSKAKIAFHFEDKKLEDKGKEGITKAEAIIPELIAARYVAHLPANYFTPDDFVSRAKEIARKYKLSVKVWDDPQLKKEGFGGILAVSRGSELNGKMIVLEYKPPKAKKKFAIVGKGITFDTGGISLKPSGEMHEMKYDMCGAAATIHAIGAIAALKKPIHVIAAIGVAENMPDGKAIKPGDVYTAYNGMTVEVQNTDAEGRLVLGDVLSYISKTYKPDYMVDLATLTGAVIIALGHEAAGYMTNSDKLVDAIETASHSSGDRVWRLPLWEEYGEDFKSDIADIKNITGGGKGAGTASAGMYLSKFVEGNVPWAHIDIAGAAWRKKASGSQPNGPTGYGVRLLVDMAEILSKEV